MTLTRLFKEIEQKQIKNNSVYVVFVKYEYILLTFEELEKKLDIKIIPSSNNLVILESKKDAINKAMIYLEDLVIKDKLKLDLMKTKWMKFRKGGRLKTTDLFTFSNKQIDYSNNFRYFGVTLQPALIFTKHIDDLKRKLISYMESFDYTDLSFEQIIDLFNSNIKPIVIKKIDKIAKYLTFNNIITLDSIKIIFLRIIKNKKHINYNIIRLVNELINEGINFEQSVIEKYKQNIFFLSTI